MYIDTHMIITAASLLTAVTAIFSVVFAVYRWYLKQNRQDEEIEKMKSGRQTQRPPDTAPFLVFPPYRTESPFPRLRFAL